ncbi:hypothetical protein EDD86DRAFT_190216 [Gorgonomyces haynaldii]|nr:hypothetical protein EDD86DRAFT_190216 [Gorgonomyces haynaldii]
MSLEGAKLVKRTDVADTHRIVCLALDGSSISEHALDWTVDHFTKPGDELVLVTSHALPRPGFLAEAGIGMPFDPVMHNFAEIEKMYEREAESLLLKACKKLEHRKIPHRAFMVAGDPRVSVTDFVNDLKPAVLIVGNRGLNVISRMALGSVSEYLLNHSQTPVLIIRKP